MRKIDLEKPLRKPDFVIGADAPEGPYMLRWYLIPRNPVFNMYYHQVLRDDDDRALHDHPWPSVSIVQKGVMLDVRNDGTTMLQPGDMVFRDAEDAHRLEVVEGPVETLFITGPKQRVWGFHCPDGWKDFMQFDNDGGCGDGHA